MFDYFNLNFWFLDLQDLFDFVFFWLLFFNYILTY